MKRAIFVGALAFAALGGAPRGAAAQSCAERCQAAYASCAALEAAGCEIGGQLAGEAASQLGEQLPIPGMGALFGNLAAATTAQSCVELLGPCKQILSTCLAECPADGAAAGGGAPAPEIRYSTLRIFSDRPRAIVYINEQRMGATPEDPLEPFVSPELRVGRYWIRLVTPDGEWEWRGEKTVEEGNVNAAEGTLGNRRLGLLQRARDLDAAGEAVRATAAYREFLAAFSGDAENAPQAQARIDALAPRFAAAEAEMSRRIEAEPDPGKRAALCRVYLDEFKEGAHRAQVERALADYEKANPRRRGDGGEAAAALPAADDRARLEAVLGEDLSGKYGEWKTNGQARQPVFEDYLIARYKDAKLTAVVVVATYSVTFVGGVIAGPILINKSDEQEKPEDKDSYLTAGAVILGVTSAAFLGSVIACPIVVHKNNERLRKLDEAKKQATALRRPALELVGFAPFVDPRTRAGGLALGWEF